MLASIVLKIKNEERFIADALESLVQQEGPLEIIVVDAFSSDRSPEIVREFAERYPFLQLHQHAGTRGEGLNHGLRLAKGEIIALTDGDVVADPHWLAEMRAAIAAGADLVAGKTMNIGLRAWEDLHRVELFNQGYDCSYPGCNLAFRREVCETVGGVDPWFITAEDVDFNIRATSAGFALVHHPSAIIFSRVRDTLIGFLDQAFWNGAGRKQLTLKHGNLWSSYRPTNMMRQEMSFWALIRLFFAGLGYLGFKFFGERAPESGT